MKFSKFLIAGSLLIASLDLLAQGDWKNAEVLLTSGETLKGLVHITDTSPGSTTIEFKASKDDAVKTFTPEEASAYKVSDPTREFRRLKTVIDYYATSPVPAGGNPIVQQDPVDVFAEVLLSSSGIILYEIIDQRNFRRFLVNENGVTKELVNAKYKQMVDGEPKSFVRTDYQKQIKSLLSDCDTKERIYKYSERPLVKAFEEITKCKNKQVDFKKEKMPDLTNVGIFGGQHFAPNSVTGARDIHKPIAGLSLQFLSNRWNNKGFIRVEAGALQTEVSNNKIGWRPYFGVEVGSYFGRRKLQPFAELDLASSFYFLPGIGGGVAYRKMVMITGTATPTLGEGFALTAKLAFIPRFKSKN